MPEGIQNHWAPVGATVQPVYTKWCPKVYVIPENQLKGLSHFNTQAIIFFSVGSALLTTVISIYVGAAFEGIPNEYAKILTVLIGPILGVISLVFFCLGGHAIWTKSTILNSIKSESQIIEPPA